jgi:prephenate dehydrogenase
MQFERVAVIGVGLIGGSFALAIRRERLARKITGWDPKAHLVAALESGLIDDVEESFGKGEICQADLVYLAAPVRAIVEFLRQRGSQIRPGALVTDAGSTKREICQAARDYLPPGVSFVGGHPMAGSHRSGLEFASPDLFQEAPYAIVTRAPLNELEPDLARAARTLAELVRKIGGRPVFTTPEAHDRAVARTSHLPQLVSVALALSVRESALDLAGSGLYQMSRLAASHWPIWEDICRTNADNIATALGEFINNLEEIRRWIESGDFPALGEAFRQANNFVAKLKR